MPDENETAVLDYHRNFQVALREIGYTSMFAGMIFSHMSDNGQMRNVVVILMPESI